MRMMIESTNHYFVQTVIFDNALVVKEKKLNNLNKHGLVEENVVLLYMISALRIASYFDLVVCFYDYVIISEVSSGNFLFGWFP